MNAPTPAARTRSVFTIPHLSAAASQMLLHVAAVFLAAFGAQLVAQQTGAITGWPILLQLLLAAAAAGGSAVIHYLLGIIPTPTVSTAGSVGYADGTVHQRNELVSVTGISLKILSPLGQVFWSLVTVFVTTFGAQLLAGASGVVNIPTLESLVISAAAAAVTAVVQAVAKVVPVPAAVPATSEVKS